MTPSSATLAFQRPKFVLGQGREISKVRAHKH